MAVPMDQTTATTHFITMGGIVPYPKTSITIQTGTRHCHLQIHQYSSMVMEKEMAGEPTAHPPAKKLKVNSIPLKFTIHAEHIPIGGCIKHFLSQWYKLTSDPNIIQTVCGCLINVVHKLPESQVHVHEIKMGKTKLLATKIEINYLQKMPLWKVLGKTMTFLVMFFSVLKRMVDST